MSAQKIKYVLLLVDNFELLKLEEYAIICCLYNGVDLRFILVYFK